MVPRGFRMARCRSRRLISDVACAIQIGTTTGPIGHCASRASLRCAHANGMPMMVMARKNGPAAGAHHPRAEARHRRISRVGVDVQHGLAPAVRARHGEGQRAPPRRLAGDAAFAISPLACAIRAARSRSIVKRRSNLPLSPGDVIVLDPQLRVVLFHELFDPLAALRGLLPIRVGDRNFLVRDLFRIVIEIA